MDPDGQHPLALTLAGQAAIGAAAGAGLDLALQAANNVIDGKDWNCSLDYSSIMQSAGWGTLGGGAGWGVLKQTPKAANTLSKFWQTQRNLNARNKAIADGIHRNATKTAAQEAARDAALKAAGAAAARGAAIPAAKRAADMVSGGANGDSEN